jgi:metal-responsive CopG/Arc/MetJ family transcriptional regulator
MARRKLSEDEKKKEFSISINLLLNDKLENYLSDNGYSNKSKYIEKLIKDDLISRGETFENNF